MLPGGETAGGVPRREAMSAEAALLASIVREPDDDGARLVYADRLEEHGRPERGEFIRLQVGLARDRKDSPARPGRGGRRS
jgi:uncharacterized protein (TIGR02996 family)